MHELIHRHGHEHSHDHHEVTPAALLAHMVEHNRSHAAELEALAGQMEGEAAQQVLAAAATMREGNAQLEKALEMLKEN